MWKTDLKRGLAIALAFILAMHVFQGHVWDARADKGQETTIVSENSTDSEAVNDIDVIEVRAESEPSDLRAEDVSVIEDESDLTEGGQTVEQKATADESESEIASEREAELSIETALGDVPSWANDPANDIKSLELDETNEISVRINGTDWNNVEEIKNGDKIEITYNWKIVNTDKSPIQYFKLDLSDKLVNIGIDAKEVANLFSSSLGYNIGEVTVAGNNVIYIKISDAKYLEESEKKGGGTLTGKISIAGTPVDDQEYTIGLGTATKKFKYNSGTPESSLGVSKQTANGPGDQWGIYYDDASGKWYQNFAINITAYNGPISNITFLETSGDVLGTITDIKVSKNGGTASAYGNFDAVQANYSTLVKDDSLQITYRQELKADKLFDPTYTLWNNNTNTFTYSYKNDKGKIVNDKVSASVYVSRPSVDKTGIVSDDKEKITWTITFNLNDYKKRGGSFNDFVAAVTDQPGEGNASQTETTVSKTDFHETEPGSGVYVAEYTTNVADSYKNAPIDQKAENTARIKTVDNVTYEKKGTVTVPGIDWNILIRRNRITANCVSQR